MSWLILVGLVYVNNEKYFVYYLLSDAGDPSRDACDPGSTDIFAHPDECQLYYNCSVTWSSPWLPGGKGVMECKYPLLYDESAHACLDYKLVECGSRQENVDGCK